MAYTIRYTYDTGDSFHTEYAVERDLGTWTSSSIAEINLQRIQEHYKYYEALHGWCFNRKDKARKAQVIKDAKTYAWYVEEYDFCLQLLADNGKPYRLSAPWCGHFEKLLGAEIVETGNTKRSFTV